MKFNVQIFWERYDSFRLLSGYGSAVKYGKMAVKIKFLIFCIVKMRIFKLQVSQILMTAPLISTDGFKLSARF